MNCFHAAREHVLSMARTVFDEAAFSAAYPDVPVPKVSLGGLRNAPPFQAGVNELPDGISAEKQTTCPTATFTWDQQVWFTAAGPDLGKCTEWILCYVDAMLTAWELDQRLGGTVDRCAPKVADMATGRDDKGYVAGASVRLTCTKAHRPNQALKEAIS